MMVDPLTDLLCRPASSKLPAPPTKQAISQHLDAAHKTFSRSLIAKQLWADGVYADHGKKIRAAWARGAYDGVSQSMKNAWANGVFDGNSQIMKNAWANGVFDEHSQKLKNAHLRGAFDGHSQKLQDAHARGAYDNRKVKWDKNFEKKNRAQGDRVQLVNDVFRISDMSTSSTKLAPRASQLVDGELLHWLRSSLEFVGLAIPTGYVHSKYASDRKFPSC